MVGFSGPSGVSGFAGDPTSLARDNILRFWDILAQTQGCRQTDAVLSMLRATKPQGGSAVCKQRSQPNPPKPDVNDPILSFRTVNISSIGSN